MTADTAQGVAITWLGQAGFAIREPSGGLCLLDPYLSNSAAKDGVERVVPILLDPSKVRADLVVTSHWHEDHHDPETIRALAAAYPGTVFAGPPSNIERCLRWGIPRQKMRPLDRGDSAIVGPFTVHAFFARHDVPGWICEDAISSVIEVGGIRIFHTGDAEYDARTRACRSAGPIDVGMFAINGTGGNMNAPEAALLAWQLGPALAVPMHYGMWAPRDYGEHATLDPQLFVDVYQRLGGGETRVLQPGETIRIPA
jgi:L-ascorbate 6-phosphate lactonase